ncbi:retinoic acid receptor responder protein 2-like isoform 2-T2 [Discoglossus pictus]
MTVVLWLVSVVLVLAVDGQVPVEELSAVQTKALTLVLEEFHNKKYVDSGFKVATLLEATETDYSAGIYVNLHFTAKQTTCTKENWRNTDCKVTKTGRTSNCFACFKFEYESHKTLSQLVDCLPQRHWKADRDEKRRESCKEVARSMEKGLGLPGSFSFVKSQ